MKTLGNDIYIQRGETWSLDFEVKNAAGDPYMLFKEWKNPYLAITVTAARYEQQGDFRKTWWLDMNNRWVEQENGSLEIIPMKRFIETEALYTEFFSVYDILNMYGVNAYPAGRIVIDPNSPFDIKNYLFFTDKNADGNNVYQYVKSYDILITYELIYKYWNSDILYDLNDVVLYSEDYTLPNGDVLTSTGYYLNLGETAKGVKPINIVVNPSSYVEFNVNSNWIEIWPQQSAGVYDNWSKDFTYWQGQTVIWNNEVYACIYPTPDPFSSPVRGTTCDPSNTQYWRKLASYLGGSSINNEIWEVYDFRIIKQFNTRDWVEQNYLFDIKVLAGESIEEYVYNQLSQEGDDVIDLPWTRDVLQQKIKEINDEAIRKQVQEIYDSGQPLMPDYDTKSLILNPTNLTVTSNIQGGIR